MNNNKILKISIQIFLIYSIQNNTTNNSNLIILFGMAISIYQDTGGEGGTCICVSR
jgi:hypothetical protein